MFFLKKPSLVQLGRQLKKVTKVNSCQTIEWMIPIPKCKSQIFKDCGSLLIMAFTLKVNTRSYLVKISWANLNLLLITLDTLAEPKTGV